MLTKCAQSTYPAIHPWTFATKPQHVNLEAEPAVVGPASKWAIQLTWIRLMFILFYSNDSLSLFITVSYCLSLVIVVDSHPSSTIKYGGDIFCCLLLVLVLLLTSHYWGWSSLVSTLLIIIGCFLFSLLAIIWYYLATLLLLSAMNYTITATTTTILQPTVAFLFCDHESFLLVIAHSYFCCYHFLSSH